VPPGDPVTTAPGRLQERADRLRERRTPFVQATVVRAVRPTSAKAGDRALVLPDGTIEGFVGGTCAESSVRLHSLRVLKGRPPVVLRIVPGDPPPGEPAAEGATAAPDSPDEGVVTVSNPCASGGMLEIFLEGVFPAPLVHVVGEAPIARALRRVGESLGYDMRPVGPSGDPVAPDAAAVVVASHGREEEPVLTAALRAGVPYVGLVASRRRGAQVAAGLDVPTWDRDRLHTPAGLDIGAATPEEVALSIFAEIVSERRATGRAAAAVAGPALPAGERVLPGHGAPAVAGPAPPAGEPALPGHGAPSMSSPPPGAAGPGSTGHERIVKEKEVLAGAGRSDEPAETVDPVCGMMVAMTQSSPHLTHDGRMWYFCGPGCRQAFADDPARYPG
jgi:xanthine dehydrogenase accessory factor